MDSELEKIDEKQNFIDQFKDMYSDEFFPSDWDQKKIKKVKEIVRKNTRTGLFTSIPMTCRSKDCPFADTCPLQQRRIAPHGSPCPIEMQMVVDFMNDYMEQLEVDRENLVEVSMIRDLVDQEVQTLRKTKWLAKEDMIQENVVGVTANGEVALRKELHMAVELEDRLLRRKQNLLKMFLATRESKAKAGMGSMDTAQTMAKLMTEVAGLTVLREKIKMEELGLVPADSYIEDAEIVDDEETEEYE